MASAFPLPAQDRFTYGLDDIMRRTGQPDHDPRWQVRYISGLIAKFGFPPPLPLMIGTTWADDVRAKSRWPQASVDQWFEDRGGPNTPAQGERDAARHGAEIMDLAAERMARKIAGVAR